MLESKTLKSTMLVGRLAVCRSGAAAVSESRLRVLSKLHPAMGQRMRVPCSCFKSKSKHGYKIDNTCCRRIVPSHTNIFRTHQPQAGTVLRQGRRQDEDGQERPRPSSRGGHGGRPSRGVTPPPAPSRIPARRPDVATREETHLKRRRSWQVA